MSINILGTLCMAAEHKICVYYTADRGMKDAVLLSERP
jgi:hypothetical protein